MVLLALTRLGAVNIVNPRFIKVQKEFGLSGLDNVRTVISVAPKQELSMPQGRPLSPLVLDVLANGKPPIHKVSEPERLGCIDSGIRASIKVTTLPPLHIITSIYK